MYTFDIALILAILSPCLILLVEDSWPLLLPIYENVGLFHPFPLMFCVFNVLCVQPSIHY